MTNDITSCIQCESCYTHWGIERCEGGARMKSGVSYCRHGHKYRKLSKRDCYKRTNSDCPKRLKKSILCVYRKELDLFGGADGYTSSFTTFRFLRECAVPVHTADDLMNFLAEQGTEVEAPISFGDVFTLFDGLCRSTWLYLGDQNFKPLSSSTSVNNAIYLRTEEISI